MISIECPQCHLRWKIPDNAPAHVTCPGCLKKVDNLFAPELSAGPLEPMPVIAVDQQVQRDQRSSDVGMVVLTVTLIVGLVLAVFMGSTVHASTRSFFAICA